MSPRHATIALILGATSALVAGCSQRQTGMEAGTALCTDGRDNDGDGAIDCADPGCHELAFCAAGGDARPDAPPPPPDGAPPPDQSLPPPPDSAPPPPDGPTPSGSYGRRCPAQSVLTPCPDGKTVCVPSKTNPDWGFCTYPCSGPGAACPEGPPGTDPHCSYEMLNNHQWYCIFVCNGPSCPPELVCTGTFCFGG